MNAREFFNKVSEMREAQKEYFRYRATIALNKSKRLEREIDAEIERVKAIEGRPQQPELFNGI